MPETKPATTATTTPTPAPTPATGSKMKMFTNKKTLIITAVGTAGVIAFAKWKNKSMIKFGIIGLVASLAVGLAVTKFTTK